MTNNEASKLYSITVNERSGRIHLAIERYDGKPIRCGWDRLQQIKNEYVGEHVTMVEYFPPPTRLSNLCKIYPYANAIHCSTILLLEKKTPDQPTWPMKGADNDKPR